MLSAGILQHNFTFPSSMAQCDFFNSHSLCFPSFGVRLIQIMTWGFWRGFFSSLKNHKGFSCLQHSHTISNYCSLTNLFLGMTQDYLLRSQAQNISPVPFSQESSSSSRKPCFTTATYIALSLFKIPMVNSCGHSMRVNSVPTVGHGVEVERTEICSI